MAAPKMVGRCGYDIPTVRDLLGHDQDSESIWAYVRAVEMETIVAEMNKEKEKVAEQPSRPAKGTVVVPQGGEVVVTGVQAL